MKEKIVWTPEEIQQVVERAVILFRDLGSEAHTDTIWRLVRDAQSVLPENRRRSITGRAFVRADLISRLTAAIAASLGGAESALKKQLQEQELKIQELLIKNEELAREAQELRARVDAAGNLDNYSFQDLCEVAGRKLGDEITQVMKKFSGLQGQFQTGISASLHPPAPKKKWEVVLAGFEDREADAIKTAVSELPVKIKLVYPPRVGQHAPPPTGDAYVFTKQLQGHRWARELKGRQRVSYVETTSSAIEAIKKLPLGT